MNARHVARMKAIRETRERIAHARLTEIQRDAVMESLFAALNAGADAGRACADAVDMARRYSEFNRIKDMGDARA